MNDEQTLIQELQQPLTRERAFTEMVRQYQEPLYAHIRRMVLYHDDADDILQNTFLKAWTAIDTFRGDSRLGTWLYRIAINETLNHLDRQKKRKIFSENEVDITNMLQSDPYFDGDEIQLMLQEAINQLPKKQRAVFNMKYFQEMKYEEMSSILDTSIGALKASYHHAVSKITDFFENKD